MSHSQITEEIEMVFKKDKCYLLLKLALNVISLLGLEVDAETVKYALCTSKLKLKPPQVTVIGRTYIVVKPDTTKHMGAINMEMQRLHTAIPGVVVTGLPHVSRAVIAVEDAVEPPTYKLCVEGAGLRDVMSTYGVVGTKTKSNNIMEVFHTLGIEAARTTIMTEITDVMEGHGMTVDRRHIMLLASQMTSRGEVLGITRFGLARMRESVLNLASVSNGLLAIMIIKIWHPLLLTITVLLCLQFERTADHLFDASYYGQTDAVDGVSERIILGIPVSIGTGIFKLMHNHTELDVPLTVDPLF